MITVKDLTVKVTYRVGLGDVEMPEKVFEQIMEAAENCDEIDPSGMQYADAGEWLSNNIREGDCMDWSAEIEEITETEDAD